MVTDSILIKLIMKLHHVFKVKLRVRTEEEIIPYGCGVRQGDNLGGTIYIMAMQINKKEIEKKFQGNNIAIPQM